MIRAPARLPSVRHFSSDGEGIFPLKAYQLEQWDSQPNYSAYASLLRQCSSLSQGKLVHAHITRHRYDQDTYLGNLLVQMYGNCSSVEEAHSAFQRIRGRNVFSWSIMLAAFSKSGQLEEARKTFERMPSRNVVSWNTTLTAYAQTGNLGEARGLFDAMSERDASSWNAMITAYAQNGLLDDAKSMFDNNPHRDVVSGNAMITAYGQYGQLQEARSIFDEMPLRSVISWNAMIQAYAQNGHMEDAQSIFSSMTKPTAVSWTTMIQGYARCRHVEDAKRMFDLMQERDVVSWNAMLTAYAKTGHLGEARNMFHQIPERSVVTWNAMVTAYAENGHLVDAKCMFDRIPLQNVVSWNSLIQAYALHGNLEDAGSMFDRMPERNIVTWNGMLQAHARSGLVDNAMSLFDEMPERNVVSWTCMIAAYAHNGHRDNAIELFQRMDLEGVKPEDVTFVSILDACANPSALATGILIHADIVQFRLHLQPMVGTALVNMYGKCGRLDDARNAFKEVTHKDAISWNTILAAYAQNGDCKESLELFRAMELDGMQPDRIAFINILSACSHGGTLDDARQYFHSMTGDYGLMPGMEHYVCMLDLLGRAGRLRQAEELITSMPYEPGIESWMSLLGGCKSHGNVDRGARAAERALQLEPDNATPYVLLSTIHARENKRRDGSGHYDAID